MNFTIQLCMIDNEKVAERRDYYYKPDYSALPEAAVSPAAIPYFVNMKVYHSNSESSSSNKSEVEYRPDGRPRRATKKKLQYDEMYPPEEPTPKRWRVSNKTNNKASSVEGVPILGMTRRFSSKRPKTSKDQIELNSDDEDYKEANKRVSKVKGYES